MKKIALRSLAAHKLRFVLTILSVVLGTAFVAGSFMFTNSLSKSFEGLFSSVYSDVDAVVDSPAGEPSPSLDLLGELEAQDGVAAVNDASEKRVVFATEQGEPLRTSGAPAVIYPYYSGEELAGPSAPIAEGSEPQGQDEIALNVTAAETHNVHVGDKLIAVDPGGRREYTVTGLYNFDADVGGYIGGAMAPSVFEETYSNGRLSGGAWVKATEGTDREQLVQQLQQEFPDLEIRTGQAVADKETETVKDGLNFLNYFLLAFGLVALLVGTFIIANTFIHDRGTAYPGVRFAALSGGVRTPADNIRGAGSAVGGRDRCCSGCGSRLWSGPCHLCSDGCIWLWPTEFRGGTDRAVHRGTTGVGLVGYDCLGMGTCQTRWPDSPCGGHALW